jgi:nicotinate phosphoribosyltransferase
MRKAAGPGKELLEFGLRRAQGPDGALSASKYAYVGGFDGTSNVLAGKLNGIPVKGTNAHAYIMGYSSLAELHSRELCTAADKKHVVDFVDVVLHKQSLLGYTDTNESELAAMISYAQAFPQGFQAIVDTYDTLDR